MSKESSIDKILPVLDSLDERALRTVIRKYAKERTLFEQVAEAVSQGIMVVDNSRSLRYRNTAAKNLLGIPDDYSTLRIDSFLKGIDWKELLNTGSRSARKEVEISYPERRILQFYVVRHPDSELSSVILTDITAAFDQTESRVSEERGKVVSMLAAGVAHEIGNPLNSLYLNLQLLERMLKNENFDKEDALLSVSESRHEIERLDSIINQFLKALRPAKIYLAPADLKEILTGALTFMRHEIENKSVNVVCDWPPALRLIQADADQLKQAFYNIIKNAIQAMPAGGSINIRCSETDESVLLEIADTGSGITSEDMTRIFQPHYTTKATGNGLGLMIVERILRGHGAKLSIDSVPGQGTTFTIEFPFNCRRVRELPPPKEDSSGIPVEQE